tara:strand:- start:62 stop:580 length:519 start_codon:yes stop_codon:yes gene_type:complete
MKIRIPFLFLTIIFLAIFLVFYKGLQNPNIYTPNTNIEKDLPNFQTKMFNEDREIFLRDIFKKDKFYLINIWASWCIPCREEHSFLISLSNQKNIEIVGLNYKDNSKNAKNFLKELDNPYQIILSDKDGTNSIELGAYGVPESFLIYNQKIIKKIIGPLNNKSFIEIKKIIK